MKQDCEYNKESAWYDEDSSEEQYGLKNNAVYALPHNDAWILEIKSVTKDGKIVGKIKSWICNSVQWVAEYLHNAPGQNRR